jgi:hypothetical protein
MSNGTKKLGKDFQSPPKFPSVTVRFDGGKLWVDFKNANWEMAVNLLIDGLKIARIEETQEIAKKAKEQIVTGDPSKIPNLRS